MAFNLALRASMLFFAAEAIILSDDPRFEGKGIGIRNALIIAVYGLVFPAVHWLGRPRAVRERWSRYPWWTDALWLSVVWVDMAGNSLDLYDTIFTFDWIPHAHTPGALTVLLMELLRMPLLSAVGVTQIIHILFEAQEFYFDVFLGTENVRGAFDTVNDLLAGVVGAFAYGAALVGYRRLRAKHEAD